MQLTPEQARAAGAAAVRAALAHNVNFAEPLFDALPDVVFFVKDAHGRYVLVNSTLVARCGLRSKAALIGRDASEVFAARHATVYQAQDQDVLTNGVEIRDQLELHLYPNRVTGWCLTQKIPLRDAGGAVVGLCGISRDLAMPDQKHPVYQRIAQAARLIQDHYDEALAVGQLARVAGVSVSQLERHFKKIFYLSPRQLLIKTRLEAATAMLSGPLSITEVAAACGYNDHSAFTRQFRATVGVTPSSYRAMLAGR